LSVAVRTSPGFFRQIEQVIKLASAQQPQSSVDQVSWRTLRRRCVCFPHIHRVPFLRRNEESDSARTTPAKSECSRHPDCPRGTSLVVSTIALMSVAPTYEIRGEKFAGKTLSMAARRACRAGNDFVPGADQLSGTEDLDGFADERRSRAAAIYDHCDWLQFYSSIRG